MEMAAGQMSTLFQAGVEDADATLSEPFGGVETGTFREAGEDASRGSS